MHRGQRRYGGDTAGGRGQQGDTAHRRYAYDEPNILCCLIGKAPGAKKTISRVRMPEYYQQMHLIREDLGVSMVIIQTFHRRRDHACAGLSVGGKGGSVRQGQAGTGGIPSPGFPVAVGHHPGGTFIRRSRPSSWFCPAGRRCDDTRRRLRDAERRPASMWR